MINKVLLFFIAHLLFPLLEHTPCPPPSIEALLPSPFESLSTFERRSMMGSSESQMEVSSFFTTNPYVVKGEPFKAIKYT